MKAGFDTGAAPAAGAPSRLPRFVAPEVPEVAKLFPQLEIQELLGQGGMGAVYRARQPALDRWVALKILPPQTSADAEFADRFTREARALARLNHPNIVGVYEFGVVCGLHYFIMEFVDGLNLRQVEQAGRIAPRDALKIIPQICDALQYAHEEGVVHRDVKPENVMLDKKGRVKITDFGLAKILGLEAKALRLTGATEVMGTPHYMAPEQIEHPQAVDHRADIYSLGVVFYEILTGELPLGRFAPPSTKVAVDVRLDEVVLHALEKEPDHRYQHASDVKCDVERIVSRPGEPPKAAAGGTLAVSPPRSEEVWKARVAVLLLLLAVGTMAAWMMRWLKGTSGAAGSRHALTLNAPTLLPAQAPFPDPAEVAARAPDPYIQSSTTELLPDGTARLRSTSVSLNDSTEPWLTYEFGNSDFIKVTNILDARRRPVVFQTSHPKGVFLYAVTLNEPVAPGQKLILTTEGVETGRVKPAGAPGLFEYAMRHWPVARRHTRRIELHRLPPGARLVDKQPRDLQERFHNGRVELFIDRLIPPGDSLEVIYRYRLSQPGGTNQQTAPPSDQPKPPGLELAGFKTVELPRVMVSYAGFDEAYAAALGRILQEALKVYEAHGFNMPQKVSLEAQIDPAGTRLWTDGTSHIFLRLKSKDLLAPASRTGVFNIYGMCHELGHIALYRNLASLMGLPPGIGEGWAHYAGSVVVTEVASRLGQSIWPEYYDVATVEGIGRLKRDAARAKPWDQLEPSLRACLVFYRIETEYGRDKLAAAMTAALADRPTGKALMPLMLEKLRAATGNPAAADWAPPSVLAPQVQWQTKERSPGDDFFADQKVEQDATGLWLCYDTGVMSGKLSISGSAQTVVFRPPEGSWELDALKLFSARYGTDEPPKEDLSIYICDESFNLLHEVKVPYSAFAMGDEKWQTVSFPPVAVPKTFYLGVDFHATFERGVYVGLDQTVKRSHSRLAMPYERVSDLKTRADWMLRPHLIPAK